MKAIILAAGYGTRLGLNIPKHLVRVAGKEMLVYLLEKLDQLEAIDQISIVTNDWGYAATEDCLKQHSFSKDIRLFNDGTTKNDARLGSMGDILFVVEHGPIDEDVLILAGDNLFEFDLGEFLRFVKSKQGDGLVLIDVKDKELAKKYGIVAVDENSKVIHFVEKPQNPPSTLAGTLCYYFTQDTLAKLKPYKEAGNDMDKAGSFIEYIYKVSSVYGWITDKTWFDIGNREQLEKANAYFTSCK